MNILVTGGSGFIGKHMVEYFNKEETVFNPTHSELDLLSAESVKQYFKEHDIDAVIHCAGVGAVKTKKTKNIIEKNMKMFVHLSEFGEADKFINMGSGAEYDKSNPLKKVHEMDFGKRVPQDEYGFSKYLISKSMVDSRWVNFRLFGVFGQYEDYENRFISNAIIRAQLRLPIIIHQDILMDWIYIDDLCNITKEFIHTTHEHNSYNITPTKTWSLLKIATWIKNFSYSQCEIVVENEGMQNEYTGSNARLVAQTRCKFTPMENGLGRMTAYYAGILNDFTTRDPKAKAEIERKFLRTVKKNG